LNMGDLDLHLQGHLSVRPRGYAPLLLTDCDKNTDQSWADTRFIERISCSKEDSVRHFTTLRVEVARASRGLSAIAELLVSFCTHLAPWLIHTVFVCCTH